MLPGQDGFDLCRQIRQTGEDCAPRPWFFLTARSDEVDRVLGLEIGGDDYMTQALQSARTGRPDQKRILRRQEADRGAADGRSAWGPFRLDRAGRAGFTSGRRKSS